MSYRIKTVSSLTGIPRATIVAWERRYNLLEPIRSPAGYRIYSDEDIQFLRGIKALTEEGLAISEAIQVAGKRVAATARGADDALPARALEGGNRSLSQALLSFDRAAAERHLPRDVSFERAMHEVYQPVLRDIGEAWARGEVTVAQEHFASAFCRERLIQMFQDLGAGPADGVPVTCVGPPGEPHDLGLLMLAIRLALRGFRVTWIGVQVPREDLCAMIAQYPPRLVCITATQPHLVAEARVYARQVRACARADTVIALGGPAVFGLSGEAEPGVWMVADFEALWARWCGERRD
jgi:DNA-binding transcriptional MerR regulator